MNDIGFISKLWFFVFLLLFVTIYFPEEERLTKKIKQLNEFLNNPQINILKETVEFVDKNSNHSRYEINTLVYFDAEVNFYIIDGYGDLHTFNVNNLA